MTAPEPRRSIIPPPIAPGKKKRAPAWNGKKHRRQVQERAGWILYEDVERRFFNLTHDYLGFGDLQLFHPERGWALEQVTVKSKLAEHVADALANKKLAEKWLRFSHVMVNDGDSLAPDLDGPRWFRVTEIPFAARIVAYPDRPARLKGDYEPRIVSIVLANGQLQAVGYP